MPGYIYNYGLIMLALLVPFIVFWARVLTENKVF